jgi:hypothetical protein
MRELRGRVSDMSLTLASLAAQVEIYCEDEVAATIAEYLFEKYNIVENGSLKARWLNLGWGEITRLLSVKALHIDNAIILLDADVPGKKKSKEQIEVLDSCKNVLYLPLQVEEGLFELLREPSNFAMLQNCVAISGFNRDICFADYPLDFADYKKQSETSHDVFKPWFKRTENMVWGRHILFDFWYSCKRELADAFIENFCNTYNKIADDLHFDPVISPKDRLESQT